jgi:hypothetical protein
MIIDQVMVWWAKMAHQWLTNGSPGYLRVKLKLQHHFNYDVNWKIDVLLLWLIDVLCIELIDNSIDRFNSIVLRF